MCMAAPGTATRRSVLSYCDSAKLKSGKQTNAKDDFSKRIALEPLLFIKQKILGMKCDLSASRFLQGFVACRISVWANSRRSSAAMIVADDIRVVGRSTARTVCPLLHEEPLLLSEII